MALSADRLVRVGARPAQGEELMTVAENYFMSLSEYLTINVQNFCG